MPYVKVNRAGAESASVYIPWPQALETGLRQMVRDALSEPGVQSVELTDDCRSRILWEEKDPEDLAAERSSETRQHRIERRHRQVKRTTDPAR